MSHEITTGAILIQDHALLPSGLRFESEPCVPGWRLVNNLDCHGLDREIQKSGWIFFCLAGVMKASVFGMDAQKMMRRAIVHILASLKSEKFNSLEITQVDSEHSLRFPLVRFVTVSAQSRHIQESLFHFRAQELPQLKRLGEVPGPSTNIVSGQTPRSQAAAKQFRAAPIWNE